MKTIVALVATVLSLSAFAQTHRPTPAPQPLILGEWTTDNPLYNGNVWIWTRFNFTQRDMTLHATCDFRGQNVNLTVGVNSQVAYNGNLIYIYERNQSSTNDGYRYCNAALSPSTWEFYFTGGDVNHAVLFAPVPYQMRFHVTRVMPEDLKLN